MKTFPTSEEVQFHGCGVLQRLLNTGEQTRGCTGFEEDSEEIHHRLRLLKGSEGGAAMGQSVIGQDTELHIAPDG